MALSKEQFEQIVGEAEPAATSEQTHQVMLPDGSYTLERRREARFRFGQRAKIRVERADQSDGWTTVMLQDISLTGISFLSDQELAPQLRLSLSLNDQAGELITIRCVVQRCEPGGFGRTSFTIGAKFQHIVTNEPKPSEPVDGTAPTVGEDADALPEDSEAKVKHRSASMFNPARLFSFWKRDYDDFSAPVSGSNLPKEMLNKINETMESFPQPARPAPLIISEELAPAEHSPNVARRSLFLHEEPAAAAPASPSPVPPPPAVNPHEDKANLEEYAKWAKRDLSHSRYVYMWAGELAVGADSSGGRILVLTGATENGEMELIALQAAPSSNPGAWKKLLLNLMRRGWIKPPKLAIGDRDLALWPALADFARGTARQYCWEEEIAHVLSLLPKGLQRLAEKEMRRIASLLHREEATAAMDLLIKDFEADAATAAQSLQQDKDLLLTFYDFPAEHWSALRDSGVIKQLLQVSGPILRDDALLMDETLAGLLKAARTAGQSWPKLAETNKLSEVLRGEQFIDGVRAAA